MVMCSLHQICYIDRNARNKKERKPSQDSSRKAVRKFNGREKPWRFGTLKCFQRILFLSIFEIHEVWVWKLHSQEKLLGTLASIKCRRSLVLFVGINLGHRFRVQSFYVEECQLRKKITPILYMKVLSICTDKEAFSKKNRV